MGEQLAKLPLNKNLKVIFAVFTIVWPSASLNANFDLYCIKCTTKCSPEAASF